MSKNFDEGRRVEVYRAIAERALGKPLPATAVVHHVNEDWTDNRNENLVICENNAYHLFLHRRLRRYKACGHADWVRCVICKEYGPDVVASGYSYYHPACARLKAKKYISTQRDGKYLVRCDGCKWSGYRTESNPTRPCHKCFASVRIVKRHGKGTEAKAIRHDNHFVTYNGTTKTIAEWVKETGMDRSLFCWRLKNWPIERVFTTPLPHAQQRESSHV